MIHIYCGDGKGKTTAAFGLALRAAGRDWGVVIAQFLKSGDSGERASMGYIPNVKLLTVPDAMKFTFAMNGEEKGAASTDCLRLLGEVAQALNAGAKLAVLDECCSAVSTGLLPLEDLLIFLDRWGGEREVVLTGRDPAPDLVERAQYVTEMKKIRHPYDAGGAARIGIEW